MVGWLVVWSVDWLVWLFDLVGWFVGLQLVSVGLVVVVCWSDSRLVGWLVVGGMAGSCFGVLAGWLDWRWLVSLWLVGWSSVGGHPGKHNNLTPT